MPKINLKRVLLTSLIGYSSLLVLFWVPFNYTTDELKDYHDNYMTIINGNCKSSQYINPWQFYMSFKDLSSEGLAGATHYSDRYVSRRLIWIDSSEWKIYNEDEKISLVFHELTHAYFNYPDLSGYNNRAHFMYEGMNDLNNKFSTYQQLNELTKDLCKSQ